MIGLVAYLVLVVPHWARTQPLDPGDGRTPAPDRS